MIAFGPMLQAFAEWFENPADPDRATALRSRDVLAMAAERDDAGPALPGILFDVDWYAAQHGLAFNNRRGRMGVLRRYIDVGSRAGDDPTPWFSEPFYRAAYPDVAAGIAAGVWGSGYQHYLTHGMAEHRSPGPDFNEMGYLGSYPDVLDVVAAGVYPSGLLHYLVLGKAEGRSYVKPRMAPALSLPIERSLLSPAPSGQFAEDDYLSTNRDVAHEDSTSGMRHWLTYGLHDDQRGERARIAGYVESIYLRENADIARLVGSGELINGYHHFLMYGLKERRRWAGSIEQEREREHLRLALTTRSLPPTGPDLPTISVIVPVYNPDRDALDACIESVRTQTYPHWELCLVDDGSSRPDTAETLVAAARADARIKVQFAARNAGISAASNQALSQATGAFVALLDHDDLLAPDALLHLAAAFRSAPDVDMVYTDEAKLAEDGTPFALNAKPGWSPDLLLSTMYVSHLTAYRREVIERAGGFRTAFDGTQDYDLALRAAELVRRVVHVPMPLYFWRLSPSSTAGALGAKPGAVERQRQALESTLLRRGLRGDVRPGHSPGHWSVVLEPPEDMPLVSIVIPTAGRDATIGGTTIDLVATCIRSLMASETYRNVEYVVVHNGDLRPQTLLLLADVPRLRLVRYDAAVFNLSDKINHGVRAALGTYVLLLNDDMQAASKGIVRSMLGCLFDGVGLVGGRLLYANGTLQHAGIVWTAEGPTHAMIGEHRLTAGPSQRLNLLHDCFGVSGACMFFRREVFLDAGGFSPDLPTNYNDVDLCIRLRARGVRIVFNPGVTMYHFESLSKTGTHFWELQRLLLGNGPIADPYWNPTYSQRSPFFELRDARQPEVPSYRAWLIEQLLRRREEYRPSGELRLSLFMSVYDTRRDQLEELEATVVNQTYRNFEWVIVDNGSSKPETLAWLERVRARDNVVFQRFETNQGIMGGYGAAFRAASGDYVVPLDSDDFITLDCLQVIAAAIERQGRPEALYSDEDKADDRGAMHSPFMKTDWDPVLFTNICYVCHVCAIERQTAVRIGAYSDPAAAFCHDWDTFLRLLRADARIVHVPEVLYSWRIHQGSTASIETGTKPQTLISQRHVLDQHMRLTGMDKAFDMVANDRFDHAGIWRLRPRRPARPKTALLLVVGAAVQPSRPFLYEVARAIGDETPVFVVGAPHAMQLELAAAPGEVLQSFSDEARTRMRQPVPLETALEQCRQDGIEVVGVLDASVAGVNRDWVNEGAGLFAAQAGVAAVAGQVVTEQGRVLWRGGFRGFGGMAGSPEAGRAAGDSGYYGMALCQRNCDAVPALGFFARTEVLQTAAAALPPGELSLRHLAGQVAVAAWRDGNAVLYTPFMQITVPRETPVEPVMLLEPPSDLPARPNYYHRAFSRLTRMPYVLLDPIEGSETVL